MSKITPYLFFDGKCREAMIFYHDCLGGELKMQTIGESPAAGSQPPEAGWRIMHATLDKGDLALMASDMMFDGLTHGNSIQLTLVCDAMEEITSFFEALSRGGKIISPLKTEFWGGTFGQLEDKYGFHWMLSYNQAAS
jgi:PhnB protein